MGGTSSEKIKRLSFLLFSISMSEKAHIYTYGCTYAYLECHISIFRVVINLVARKCHLFFQRHASVDKQCCCVDASR